MYEPEPVDHYGPQPGPGVVTITDDRVILENFHLWSGEVRVVDPLHRPVVLRYCRVHGNDHPVES
jgi:hypothetical protein